MIFTSPKDVFVDVENTNVGNAFDDRPSLQTGDYTSPAFGTNIGIGAFYVTDDGKEFNFELQYNQKLSQIFDDISDELSSFRVIAGIKL